MRRSSNSAIVNWLAWVAFALGIAADLLAHPFNWYQRLAWFDELLHAYTSGTVALLVSLDLARRLFAERGDRRLLRFTLAFCVTLTIGVAWEIAEWIYDMTTDPNTIKGKWDTMVDFCMDAAGATLGALVGLCFAPARRDQR